MNKYKILVLKGMERKSLCVAYLLWLIGGLFGLHLLYLRRDKQAFLYWCTFGGYFGIGPLRDFVRIPSYVHDINETSFYVKDLAELMRKKKKPPFQLWRFVGQIVVGNSWAFLFLAAIPQEDIFGMSPGILVYLSPLATALGTWVVGNIGREQGSPFWPCIGALSVLPIAAFFPPALAWSCFFSPIAFEWKGKQWRRTPYVKHSVLRRAMNLGSAWMLFCSLLCFYVYFNAEITYKDGEKAKVKDAIKNFFNSPLYLEFKKNLGILYGDIWEFGWRKALAHFIEMMDPLGEQHALKVLELENGATQKEVYSQYKKLSKEWHPDRHKGLEDKTFAQEKFVEIAHSYEKLSSIKKRRKLKNNISDKITDEAI